MDVKRCGRCQRVLPRTEEFFFRNRQNSADRQSGWAVPCKNCRSVLDRVRRTKTVEARAKYNKEYRRKNRDRLLRQQHEARLSHPYRWRDVRFKAVYGITFAEYEALLTVQGGLCAICGGMETATYRGKLKLLQVDHDHRTGKVRGLLCGRCNRILANAGDDPNRLMIAVRYLDYQSASSSAARSKESANGL